MTAVMARQYHLSAPRRSCATQALNWASMEGGQLLQPLRSQAQAWLTRSTWLAWPGCAFAAGVSMVPVLISALPEAPSLETAAFIPAELAAWTSAVVAAAVAMPCDALPAVVALDLGLGALARLVVAAAVAVISTPI